MAASMMNPSTAQAARYPPLVGATYAPLTSSWSSPFLSNLSSAPSSSPFMRYLRRGLYFSQWDIDYTLYQFVYSCRDPQRVYKLTLHRKQTKNQWFRDDPTFTLVLLAFLVVSAVAYGLAYRQTSVWSYLWLIQGAIASFVLWGGILSVTLWASINRYARSAVPLPHSVEQKVEWLYAWDVHCNAFVPVLLLIHVLQYLLLPLTMGEGFLPALLGNTIYAAALCHYFYITFWGYSVLPFLQQDKLRLVLLPIGAIVVMYILFTLLQFNVASMMMGWIVA